MAWSTLTFPFGSTLSSTTMTAMQANFTALAQGLSGAPKIKTAALNQVSGSEAVTTATIRAGAVTLAKLPLYVAGNYVEAASYGAYAAPASGPYYLVKTYTMVRGGTVRVNATAIGATTEHGDILLYKNDVYTGYVAGAGGSISPHSNFPADITVTVGDTLKFYVAVYPNPDTVNWTAYIMTDGATSLVPRAPMAYIYLGDAGQALL